MKDFLPCELARRLYCAIDWPRKVVGIRFLFTKEEFDLANATNLQKPIHYCQMVNAATHGNAVKGSEDAQGCPAAAIALGIKVPDEFQRSGRRAFANCLYHDQVTAKQSRDRQTICDHRAFGVLVKPLEQYGGNELPPHIVHVITNPYYAMRIIQGYTYYYGIKTDFKMSGLQAMCSESTAYPYMSNDINLSMLCGGTRDVCKWKDNELNVSIPYSKLALTIEGTLRTMNLEDPDTKKNIARSKLKANNMYDEFPLENGFNYCKLPHNLKN